jgi:hypothetical protein
MIDEDIRLILRDAEAEVLREALELYLSTRRTPADPRFDYRYRIAHGVLDSLLRPGRIDSTAPPDADDVRKPTLLED